MKNIFFFIFFNFFVLNISVVSAANSTPDSTSSGPYTVKVDEYRLPAAIDEQVLTDREIEIWGKIFYPNEIKTPLPLIVMLHGNHATCVKEGSYRESCDYTNSGICPRGYSTVANHEGYDYIAKNLASWGFIVTSINANRGITCGSGVAGDWGLNLARGRLVLKHLSLLYQWNKQENVKAFENTQWLLNKIDFSSVGLFGHSRGGEGIRAAYNLYHDSESSWPAKIPGLNIKAIFEVGAVDGQTSRILDAKGVAWNQLLPMCDGDVDTLEGRYPYERMLTDFSETGDAQKSLYEVWGANHNFFNTQWPKSDAYTCRFGTPIFDHDKTYSLRQQTIALASVSAFFRSWLLKEGDKNFNRNFNPLYQLPTVVNNITHVDRDFSAATKKNKMIIVDDFDKETGFSSLGYENISHQIEIENIFIDKAKQRAAKITWNYASADTFYEAILTKENSGRSIVFYKTLDFRIRRLQNNNVDKSIDFNIALEDEQGSLSNLVPVSEYAQINGPGNINNILMTVRIPLTVFQGVNHNKIRGVRFIFNKTKSDGILLANIRFQKEWGSGGESARNSYQPYSQADNTLAKNTLPAAEIVPAHFNKIIHVRRINKSRALNGGSGIEMTFVSEVPFLVMNRLPILKIGDQIIKLSRYSDPTHLKEITFTLTAEQFKDIAKSAAFIIEDGKIWKFNQRAESLQIQ